MVHHVVSTWTKTKLTNISMKNENDALLSDIYILSKMQKIQS